MKESVKFSMDHSKILSFPSQPFHKYLSLILLLAGFLVLFTSPARADLRVCNQIGKPVSVALGYRGEDGWLSEGWWVVAPDACTIVFQGDLDSRYYYLFAADDISGGTWDGKVFMCTRDAPPFTIFGVEDCLARGYERTGFFEIDTENRTDWTLQLTESDISPPQN